MAGGGKSSDLDGAFPAPPAAKYCTIQNRPGNVTMKNYQNVHIPAQQRQLFWFQAQQKYCAIKETGGLSTEEIIHSEENVFKLDQQESFLGAKDPPIVALHPAVDYRGLIRLWTKISNRWDSLEF